MLLENRFFRKVDIHFPEDIIEKSDTVKVRAAICTKFESWLKTLKKEDTAFLYLSAPLLTDPEKKVVLPTVAFDEALPHGTTKDVGAAMGNRSK